MFGGKTNGAGRPATANGSGNAAGLNSLVSGTTMKGELTAPSDIRIEGTLEGDLDCQAKVIIGATGRIDGSVRCKSAMIEGSFEGTLYVQELLEIRETATVSGDITYGKLKIDPGAAFTGTSRMVSQENSSTKAASNGKAAKPAAPVEA